MGNVVNLNKFRKQKAKQASVKQADTNRRFHGRTDAERARDALQKKQLESKLSGAHLDSPPEAASASDGTCGDDDDETR